MTKSIDIETLKSHELDKSISVISEFLDLFEKLTKKFYLGSIHTISRLVFGKRLLSLHLYSTIVDEALELIYKAIGLTAKNIFDVNNQFKLKKKANLLSALASEATTFKEDLRKKFKDLRNKSPLSHNFKSIDLGVYTVTNVTEILSCYHNF